MVDSPLVRVNNELIVFNNIERRDKSGSTWKKEGNKHTYERKKDSMGFDELVIRQISDGQKVAYILDSRSDLSYEISGNTAEVVGNVHKRQYPAL